MNLDERTLKRLAMLCLTASLSLASLASASPPGPVSEIANTQPASSQPLASSPASETETSIDGLRQKLAAASEALAQATARAARTSSTDVATQEEIAESEALLRQIVRAYQRQIDSLRKVQSLRQSRARLEREMADWTGLPNPPPYSFLMIDELRAAANADEARLQALTAMGSAIEQEAERRKGQFEASGEKLRQANERLEGNGTGNARLVWLRDLEALRKRFDEARMEGIQIERQAESEELAEIRQRLEFTRRQLGEANRHVAFADEDKKQVRNRLEAERQQLQVELDAALPTLDTSRKALDEAQAALNQGRQTLADGGDSAGLNDLANQVELQRERSENAAIKFQLLNRLLDFVKVRGNIWELRWSLAGPWDAERNLQAYAKIASLQKELQPMMEFAAQRLKLTTGQIFDTEKQLADPASAALTARYQQLRDLYAEREASYRRMLWGLETSAQLLAFCKQDLDDRRQTEPLSERAQEWLAQIRADLAAVWAFEIFAVQDSIEVEGQTITGKRSVTLGKLATALLILVVGLWLAARLSHAVERGAVRRGRLDAGSARIARRWVMFLVGLVLVATSLAMVKIPLTVFAFTGGALAIGAGFGMQNLLKNLISGLMLLVERPFRPGDLVEVAGIRGRVVDIGVRSSHIRDANGIETLIPNSTFVEENVTNWTLSSRSVRINVKLGVAYGSPVQLLDDLLLEVADRHGLVEKEPAPQVLFEDFGADALQFGLYVWVDIKPGVDWRAIASDLRYMINKTLAANGIAMAFPQRDIHVDATQPLQVRVLRETEG